MMISPSYFLSIGRADKLLDKAEELLRNESNWLQTHFPETEREEADIAVKTALIRIFNEHLRFGGRERERREIFLIFLIFHSEKKRVLSMHCAI